jgi:hypothetical protein
VQKRLKEIAQIATEAYDDFKGNAGSKSARALRKLRGEFTRLYSLLIQVEVDAHDSDAKAAVAKTIEKLEKMSKAAHEKCNLTYAPLPELIELQGGRA